MLSTPVEGVTSLVATPEAATLQEVQTDNIYLQQTMQVRKRTGSAEAGRCHQDRVCRPMSDVERR